MIDRPNDRMRKRLLVWLTAFIAAVVIYTLVCIFKVSVTESKKWQTLANSQQLTSTRVPASRGTIYDSNGQVLAQSATVYTVYADCVMLWEYIDGKDELIGEYDKLIAEEDDEKKRAGYIERKSEIKSSEDTYNELEEFLAQTLDIDKSELAKKLNTQGSQYEILKKEVDKTDAEKIEDYLTEIDIDGIRCDPTTKRFYPQNSLAANVIGHTDYDGAGIYGIENYYDDQLSGIDGRIVTASDKNGTEIPYKYKQSYDAQNGDSLYLNIDANIQYYLEKALDDCVQENKPAERACGIIMNPNTGEVYAMATNFSYDPNQPAEISDEMTARKLAALDEDSDEYLEAKLNAWNLQWRNKAISEIYTPGSVFKVITASGALEEKAITLNDTFYCGTSIHVEDRNFSCWSTTDHGGQDLQHAMTNSCNPAFVQIGQRLGSKGLYKYLKAYGFLEKTGIDLPAESNSICLGEDMTLVDLAAGSFGQANSVTPIQMITAYSAVINGGYLVTPQIVDKIVDSNGNVVEDKKTVVRRQVISSEVSGEMRSILENVVNENSGSNAYIQGYKIGGKSGTSQKLEKGENVYVSSYCAFAPADDPEIIMLLMVDEPQGEKFYGSQVAAPVCTKVLSEVLPYLGFLPEYTEEELEQLEVSVPNMEYRTISEAQTSIEALGLQVKIVGEGDTVLRQNPTGVSVERGGTVVLYTDDTTPEGTVSVPDIEGLSKEYAKQLLQSYGLNMTAEGSAANVENAYAVANPSTGMTVTEGTAITVSFSEASVGSW